MCSLHCHNDTHHQTGVAERHNRTIAERIRALLHASGLPKNLWGEVAWHVVWLLNRTTTKAVEGMTLFEAAFGKKPNLKGVREWGEKVYVRVEKGLSSAVELGKAGGLGWMRSQREHGSIGQTPKLFRLNATSTSIIR